MGWTWKRLLEESDEQELGLTGLSAERLIAGFNEAERLLGSQWIQRCGIMMPRAPDYSNSRVFRGVTDILEVLEIASALGMVATAPGAGELIAKLKKRDTTALSELKALTLLRGEDEEVHVEFGPEIEVGHSTKRPDLRLTKRGESVVVEVSQMHTSEQVDSVRRQFREIVSAMAALEQTIAVEVGLHREVSEADVLSIVNEVGQLASRGLPGRDRIDGLAELRVADPQEASFPQLFPELGTGPLLAHGGAPPYPSRVQHVSVTIPYSDARADAFLKKEARQLPERGPGVLVADVSNAHGAFAGWTSLLARRLQPSLHTRVGAVVVMRRSEQSHSYGVVTETNVVRHPMPACRYPDWFEEALVRLSSRPCS